MQCKIANYALILVAILKVTSNVTVFSKATKKHLVCGNKSTEEDSMWLFPLLYYLHNAFLLSFSKYLLSTYCETDAAQR